jgi:hypothetical protein
MLLLPNYFDLEVKGMKRDILLYWEKVGERIGNGSLLVK